MTGTTAPDPDAPTGAETSPGSPAGAPGTPGSSPAEAAPPRPSSLSRPLSSSAVFGTGDLAQTPMHYGEPLREQRALAERGAIVDLPHVRVLRLTGADRLTWLNSITTQKIDTLAPGVSTEAAVQVPSGRSRDRLRINE